MKYRAFNCKEKEAYLFIQDFIIKNKYSPSFQEIIDNTGYLSKGSINTLLKKLKDKDLINYINGEARTISLNNIVLKIDKRKDTLC